MSAKIKTLKIKSEAPVESLTFEWLSSLTLRNQVFSAG
jgi:hypothetical protein